MIVRIFKDLRDIGTDESMAVSQMLNMLLLPLLVLGEQTCLHLGTKALNLHRTAWMTTGLAKKNILGS